MSLKNFQQRTVDHVCRRMLDEGARNFLVADEVGLGKTLVARGVVERTVKRLRAEGVRRVDVVYVCSNQEIAKQNLRRLQVASAEATALPSRITLLPLHLAEFQQDGVNFVSFTPGTSFEPRSRGGWTRERALLLRMLRPVWNIPRHRGVFEVFRLGAHRSSLERELKNLGEPDPAIEKAFAAVMTDSPLRGELESLMEAAQRRQLRPDEREQQLTLIGALRRELARVCVDELEPDLVILDEFQRFAELLDGETEAAELAQQLFKFSNDRGEYARVLLLSATPFKAYSHAGEDGSAHSAELHRLLRFLFDDGDKADDVQQQFGRLRSLLLGGRPDHDELSSARRAIEERLAAVMVRTERLASTATRNGMLEERPLEAFALQAKDVRSWVELARLHRILRDRDLLSSGAALAEYWKSAPWLAQFMDAYALKRAVDAAVSQPRGADDELDVALEAVRKQLSWGQFARYGELKPANARLRALQHDTVDAAWDLLWLPPSMPYHQSNPPFDREGVAGITKRLIFSSWDVVPRGIAGYLSYEAERRVHRASGAATANTKTSRRGLERRLLDFKLDATDVTQRPASMTTLALLAPSVTLTELGDVRNVVRTMGDDDSPSAKAVLDAVRRRLTPLIDELTAPIDETRTGPDARWYVAAPLLLDRGQPAAVSFWARPGLAEEWTAGHARGLENLNQHLEEARQLMRGDVPLGRKPDDLTEVLARLAVAGPGNVAARALRAVLPETDGEARLLGAARVGWGLRQLFNAPEAIAIVEHTQQPEAYWRQVLAYALAGNLQATLDEWAHLIAEDVAAGREDLGAVQNDVVDRMLVALGLGASRVEVDKLDGRPKTAWRTHFAVRYGQGKDDATETVHPEAVRRAFNSPLRPFVLASTSVGQEGLDFHTYCHAIVHWNLPSNPVDLEQREGRVHRYKGHAIRRNVAAEFGAHAIRSDAADPWEEAFDAAVDARPSHEDDLVPFWLYPGYAQIERYVPALPFSKDAERHARVLRQVTLYRMVFGQPRQDDLIAYLQSELGQDEAERLADLVRIDLSPPVGSDREHPRTSRD